MLCKDVQHTHVAGPVKQVNYYCMICKLPNADNPRTLQYCGHTFCFACLNKEETKVRY